MNAAQKALKNRIMRHKNECSYMPYIPPGWNEKIFSKTTSAIREYMLERLEEAQNESEYYVAMSYLLTPSAKFDYLLVEWRDSTQYKRFLKTLAAEDKKDGTIRPPQKSVKKVPKTDENTQKSEEKVEKATVKVKKTKVEESTLKTTMKKTRIVQMKL